MSGPRFNLEPRQEHFFENLPFYPIDFATLEIETRSARDNLAGVFISLTAFSLTGFIRATRVQLTCRLLTDLPTGYDLSPLKRHF
jgi:hypothetical protein